ncbi:MAG: protealysin inhibitor emfourin [Gammaproteobacteria bacterium]
MDPESLPTEQAQAIRRLINEVGFFDLPGFFPASGQGADRFQYNLTIEDDGKRHSVEIHDTETLPEPLKQLLKVLTDIARSRP